MGAGGDGSSGSSKRRRRRRSCCSTVVNTNIDDLPDNVLANILSRLPRNDHLSTYWYVCQRWRSIFMSDLYFRGLYLLRHKQPQPQARTLINRRGETNFPIELSFPSSPKFLSWLFERLMSAMSLTREPVVVGASNELILCCATESFQRDYYICNPYSLQWVKLPPASRVLHDVPVGFICDPYYSYIKKQDKHNVHQTPRREKSAIIDDGNEDVVVINHSYRYKVVRILPYDDRFEGEASSKFKLDIFSFETWEWRESIISFPRSFTFDRINSDSHFSHNGMLYWSGTWRRWSRGETSRNIFLIGLDPFMINEANMNPNSSRGYEGSYIELAAKHQVEDPLYSSDEHYYQIKCLSTVRSAGGGGCLQVCVLDSYDNSILIWELKEEKDLIIAGDGARVLCSEGEVIRVHRAEQVELIGFDPDVEGLLYVRRDGVKGVEGGSCYCKINVVAREYTNLAMDGGVISNNCFFPINLDQCWPTPVPSLMNLLT